MNWQLDVDFSPWGVKIHFKIQIHFNKQDEQENKKARGETIHTFSQHSPQHTRESRTLFGFISTSSSVCKHWLAMSGQWSIKFPSWKTLRRAKTRGGGRGRRGKTGAGVASRGGWRSSYLVRRLRTAALRPRQPRPNTALTSCLALEGSAAHPQDWKEAKEMWWSRKYLAVRVGRQEPARLRQTHRQTRRDLPLPLHNAQSAARCQSFPLIKHKSQYKRQL